MKRTYFVSRVDRAARPDGGCLTTWTVRRRVPTGGSVQVRACDTRAEARILARHLNSEVRDIPPFGAGARLRVIQGGRGA